MTPWRCAWSTALQIWQVKSSARVRSSAPLQRDDVLERFARHVLHHDEEDVVLLLRRGDRDDVGMAELGEQPRLAQQLAEVEVLPVRDLDRDLLVDPGVFGEVDRAESAAAERREDSVLAERLAFEQQCECEMLRC